MEVGGRKSEVGEVSVILPSAFCLLSDPPEAGMTKVTDAEDKLKWRNRAVDLMLAIDRIRDNAADEREMTSAIITTLADAVEALISRPAPEPTPDETRAAGALASAHETFERLRLEEVAAISAWRATGDKRQRERVEELDPQVEAARKRLDGAKADDRYWRKVARIERTEATKVVFVAARDEHLAPVFAAILATTNDMEVARSLRYAAAVLDIDGVPPSFPIEDGLAPHVARACAALVLQLGLFCRRSCGGLRWQNWGSDGRDYWITRELEHAADRLAGDALAVPPADRGAFVGIGREFRR